MNTQQNSSNRSSNLCIQVVQPLCPAYIAQICFLSDLASVAIVQVPTIVCLNFTRPLTTYLPVPMETTVPPLMQWNYALTYCWWGYSFYNLFERQFGHMCWESLKKNTAFDPTLWLTRIIFLRKQSEIHRKIYAWNILWITHSFTYSTNLDAYYMLLLLLLSRFSRVWLCATP